MLTTKKWGAKPPATEVSAPATPRGRGCRRPIAELVSRSERAALAAAVVLVLAVGCGPAGPRALRKGVGLLREGRPAEAIPPLKEAVILLATNTPACAQAWNYLGLAYHRSGRLPQADQAYQLALSKDFNLVEARYNRGCLLLEQNNLPEAINQLTTYTSHRGQRVDGWIKLGTAQLRARQLETADASFQQALRLNPPPAVQAEAVNGLAMTQVQRRRPREAYQLLQTALRCQTNYAPALLNQAVLAHQAFNDRPLALQKFQAYLACAPRGPQYDAAAGMARSLAFELRPVSPPPATNQPPAASAVAAAPPASATTNLPVASVRTNVPAPPAAARPESATNVAVLATVTPPAPRPAPPAATNPPAPAAKTNVAPAGVVAKTGPATGPPPRLTGPSASPAKSPAVTNAAKLPPPFLTPPPKPEPVTNVARVVPAAPPPEAGRRPAPASPPSALVRTSAPPSSVTRPELSAPTTVSSPPAAPEPRAPRSEISLAPPVEAKPPAMPPTVGPLAPRETPPAPKPPEPPPLQRVKLDAEPEIRPAQDPISALGNPPPKVEDGTRKPAPAVVSPAARPPTPAEPVSAPSAPPSRPVMVPPPEPKTAPAVPAPAAAGPQPQEAASPETRQPFTLPPLRSVNRPAPEKKPLLQKINPLRWFSKKDDSVGGPPPLGAMLAASTLPTNAAPRLVMPAPPPKPQVFARYRYLSPLPPSPGNREEATRLLLVGAQAHREGRTTEAVAAYRQAAEADPACFEARYNLGVAAYETGDWPQALGAYEQALTVDAASVNARFNFALALQKANYPVDAAKELETILEKSPTNTTARFTLANLSAQVLKDPRKAREHYLKVLEAEPRHPQANAIRSWLATHSDL